MLTNIVRVYTMCLCFVFSGCTSDVPFFEDGVRMEKIVVIGAFRILLEYDHFFISYILVLIHSKSEADF